MDKEKVSDPKEFKGLVFTGWYSSPKRVEDGKDAVTSEEWDKLVEKV